MPGKITVNEAITRAVYTVTLPSMAIAFGTMVVAFRLNEPWYIIGDVIVGGGVITWIYWSLAGTKWQICAYTNCDAFHDLRDKATSSNIICDESSPWNKLVLRTPADKRALGALQSRFTANDTYDDNPAVPAVTTIYFSKSANVVTFVLGVFFLALGAYAAFATVKYLIEGIVVIGFGIYCCYRGFSRTKDRSAQLILSDKGIQTATVPFHDWSQIHEERIELVPSGTGPQGSTTAYLLYRYPGGVSKTNLDDMTADSDTIDDLLKVYRVRSGKGKVYSTLSADELARTYEKRISDLRNKKP